MIKNGKTYVKVQHETQGSRMEAGDVCYIDGYAQFATGRPCAVIVRDSDGVMEWADIPNLKAIKETD